MTDDRGECLADAHERLALLTGEPRLGTVLVFSCHRGYQPTVKDATPAVLDYARRSFWLLPASGVALGVILGFALPAIDSITHVRVPLLSFRQPQAARTLLQTMATVSVSVGGVAFSVTVVAFQLASQQLSPRVLRTFQADRLSQTLLGALLGLFVFSLIVLARLPSSRNVTVPGLSLTVGIADAVFAFALFAAFIHNVVISLQASTLIRRIAADGHRAIDAGYPSSIGDAPSDIYAAEEWVRKLKKRERGVLVRSTRAGFLQTVRRDDLLSVSRKHNALVEQRLQLGDFAMMGAVLAEVWAESEHQDVAQEVRTAFGFGDERTVVQDVSLPVRQLADIALRALSPALNDPTTAENAMGSLADHPAESRRARAPGLRSGAPRECVLSDHGESPARPLSAHRSRGCGKRSRFRRAGASAEVALPVRAGPAWRGASDGADIGGPAAGRRAARRRGISVDPIRCSSGYQLVPSRLALRAGPSTVRKPVTSGESSNGKGLLGLIGSVPLVKQLSGDPLGLARAARSVRSERLIGRTATAERVVQSVCPYCAVGCAQRVYVKDEDVIQIEGDPDSPVSRGRLCPKGAGSLGLVKSPTREYKVKYRRPYGTEWEELSLERAIEMIADRVIDTREQTWESELPPDDDGRAGGKLNRTLGFASLGGATLDNEENYLMKKFFSALGAVQIENQARI